MAASAYVLVNRTRVEDFESLRESVPASTSEVVQLEQGRMSGFLTHISIGDFSLSSGSFSLGVRTQGIFSDRKLTFGILLDASDKVSTLCHEMRPGDIGVSPPGVEHCCRYYGGASFAAISVCAAEFFSFLQSEPALRDLKIWRNRTLMRTDPIVRRVTTKRLNAIISWMSEHGPELSGEAAGFWKKSLLEFITTRIMSASALDDGQQISSASALVRKVEDYVGVAGVRPMHISEICAEFGVSRRSLHRAFDEVLGMAPVTFLRHKRLCAVHSILRDGDPAKITVADAAMQQGFAELGRFSHYYHSLFGEYPSETLGGRHRGIRRGAGLAKLNVQRC
jgi:AraC family ethanolamine operon transcriptional activator